MNVFLTLLLVFSLPLSGNGSDHPKKQKLSVIAHRGAAAHAPENTLSAFRIAIEMHADALELDVRQTRDSQLVIMHDADVDRTSDGSGAVSDLSLAEIKALDAGSWFSAKYFGERIPTLQEVMDRLDSSTALILELK